MERKPLEAPKRTTTNEANHISWEVGYLDKIEALILGGDASDSGTCNLSIDTKCQWISPTA